MDKSKLPKPSGLRQPQKVDIENRLGTASKFNMGLKRRSKSFSDLPTASKLFRQPLRTMIKPLQNVPENVPSTSRLAIQAEKKPLRNLTASKPIQRRRSKSASKMQVSTVKTALLHSKATVNVKAPVKRNAPGPSSDETKPKVIKQAKIPDWDYKSKFQQLNERYTKLQDANKTYRDRLSAIDENYNQMQIDLEQLHSEKITMVQSNAELTTEVASLKNSYKNLDAKFKELTSQHNNLLKAHEVLREEQTQSLQTINELTNKNCRLKLEYDSEVVENQHLATKLEDEKRTNFELNNEIGRLKTDLETVNVMRRNLHNTIQDLKGNIRVYCRVRAPKDAEEEDLLQCSINYLDESSLEIRKTRSSVSVNGKMADIKAEFKFDKIFSPDNTQEDIFKDLCELVQSALDGYNVCVFAYGQTGSGKTYTMQGETDNPHLLGIIPRTIDFIFKSKEQLEKDGWKYSIHASFLEIYNENIRDLLDIKSKKTFDIRFNEGKGTTVTNLTIQEMKSAIELKNYMNIAHRNRSVAATNFNEHSSRSHAVTKIYLEGTNNNTRYTGSINLVDLAGSESAKTSSTERLIETKNINKSLSTLANVMISLYNKNNHIPFRNSKLTYLLQSSLGGNSKTLMFVNIAPFEDNYMESINSLRFASTVKEVKLTSKKNKTVTTG